MSATVTSPFAAVPAALLAGLLLTLLIARLGRGEFPIRLFGAALSLGVVMAALIVALEGPFNLRTNAHGFSALTRAFGFAGFPEEAAKMAAAYFFLRPHYLCRTRRDLVLGAAAAALGFALLENILYVAAAGENWGAVATVRAVASVPIHVFLGVAGGFAVAQAEYAASPFRAGVRVAATWIAISVLHGFCDLPLLIANAKPPYPNYVELLAGKIGVSAVSFLFCVLLATSICVCFLAFYDLRSLDRAPSAPIHRQPTVPLAPNSRLGRFFLMRGTGWVVAGLLLAPSLIALVVSAVLSFVADQMTLVLVTAFLIVCPVTIALMLLWFPPRPSAEPPFAKSSGMASPTRRRRRRALAAIIAAITLFAIFRWGGEAFRAVVATRIEFKGQQSAVKGDPEAAIREYDRALAFDPDLVDALVKRAQSNQALQRYDLSLSDLDRAVLLAPRSAELLLQRSELHRSMHAPQSAVADADRALALAPDNPEVWAASAEASLDMRESAKANAQVARAIELGPKNAWALRVQARLFSGAGQYDEAVQSLDEDLRTNQADFAGLFARGRLWFYKGDMGKAAADLKRINIPAFNLYPALWLFLAHSRAGAESGPELAAQTLQSSNYKWPFPVVQFFLGQMSAAEARAAAANDDQRCEADFYNGEFLLNRGERAPAIAALRLAESECPSNFVEYEGASAELRRLDREAAASAAKTESGENSTGAAAPAGTENRTAATIETPRGENAPAPGPEDKASMSAVATASISNGGTRYSGSAVWSFIEREKGSSELDAVLLFSDSSIHGELSLKRNLSAGSPQYALFFTVLASDRTVPPFSQLGATLGAPLLDARGSRVAMPSMSDFQRIDDTTYRMILPSESIQDVLSDLASGAQVRMQLEPTHGWKMTLTFDLNTQTARVSRLAANAWR